MVTPFPQLSSFISKIFLPPPRLSASYTLPPPLLSPGSPLRAVHGVPRFHTTPFSDVYLVCSPP